MKLLAIGIPQNNLHNGSASSSLNRQCSEPVAELTAAEKVHSSLQTSIRYPQAR